MIAELLSRAKTAINQGDKAKARIVLRKAILISPQHAQAWFLMAQVVEKRAQVVDCLQRVTHIDPDHQAAANALKALMHKPAPSVKASIRPAPPTSEKTISEPIELPVQTQESLKGRTPINWSLVIGSVIVFFVLVVSILGPKIAPGDPLQENVILKFGDVWDTPPIPPFMYKEFPFGTDQFGRDLFSRILWAVQPTITMVSTVALVRLLLGTLIGLSAGWSRGLIGNWLDTLITAALAIPVFLVTLGAIAMLGAEMGLMAFIIGFSINGWGETARIVRMQTQAIKQQLYIEAAESIGLSQIQILFRHVLRQIMPMVWILLAFEISNTLMVTAGLGFLGYYIGGDVWIEVGDFVSRRVSGMPELGQMLATSWTFLTKPWPMVVTGTIIFITVLGFNLFGEGLQLYLNPERGMSKNRFSDIRRRFSWWLEERAIRPINLWARENVLFLSVIGTLIVVVSGSFYLWRTQFYTNTVEPDEILVVPGDHLWGSERGDPYGTYWPGSPGPTHPRIKWQHQIPDGFSGGPVVAANHIIYIGTNNGHLLALNPDGSTLWDISLPEIPVGSPALSTEGVVYIGNQNGGLMAIEPQGELLWHFKQEEVGKPLHGPIVDQVGNIYYLLDDPRGDHLLSLTSDGELRWSILTDTRSAGTGPRLDPTGDVIYLKNVVIDSSDGSLFDIETPADQDPVLANRTQYFIGADGEDYLHVGHIVINWQLTQSGFEVIESSEWNYRTAGFNQFSSFPQDAGVTPDRIVWLFYSNRYGGTKMVWVDVSGKMLGISWTSLRRNSKLIAIDSSNTAYLCGEEETPEESVTSITKCLAFDQAGEEPKWELILNEQGANDVIGGALVPDTLYVVTEGGFLYAIEQDNEEPGGSN
jgi:peptide/nickel transport system permease protein